MRGGEGGEENLDDAIAAKRVRSPAPGSSGGTCWSRPRSVARRELEGLVGEEPPYHTPVFVLTHHARALDDKGGTDSQFVTDGIYSALEQAKDAARRRTSASAAVFPRSGST